MPARPEVSVALLHTLLIGALLLIILLVLVCGWFLARQRLLAMTLAVVATLLGLALLMHLRELLVLFLIAAALAFILDRPIQRLERFMPRGVAIAVVYLGAVAAIATLGALLVPRIFEQAERFKEELPSYQSRFKGRFDLVVNWYQGLPPAIHAAVERAAEIAKSRAQEIITAAAELLVGIVGWVVKGIIALVMSVYLLTDKQRLRDAVFRIAPSRLEGELRETLTEIGGALGAYLRAEAVVILFVAMSVTLVLLLFRIPYALFIGLGAGILEVIPYFGAFAGAIPAVALAFSKSWVHGVGIIGAFILINQVEGHVVLPLVVGHQLEMRPLWILLSLLAGHFLFGVPGMILAVPVVSILRIIVPRLYRFHQALQHREQHEGVPVVE